MTYEYLSNELNTLTDKILLALKKEIINNNCKSAFSDSLCITVNVFNYTELIIFNDDLIFLDDSGYQYNIFSECTLEDLIDILNKI